MSRGFELLLIVVYVRKEGELVIEQEVASGVVD